MKPDEKNKKNLELTKVQLRLDIFLLVKGYAAAATLSPEHAEQFFKFTNVFGAILDTGFGIGEQQTQDKDE